MEGGIGFYAAQIAPGAQLGSARRRQRRCGTRRTIQYSTLIVTHLGERDDRLE